MASVQYWCVIYLPKICNLIFSTYKTRQKIYTVMSQSLSVLLLFISFFKIVLPSSVNQDEKVNIITDKPKYF